MFINVAAAQKCIAYLIHQVELPTCELVLAPRDDTAEFDDSIDQLQAFEDDPRYDYIIHCQFSNLC